MSCKYKLIITEKMDDQGVIHTVYGVKAEHESGEIEREIPDIFLDRTIAERFVEACNILSLDPDHLDDVIADALCV